ncbi:MAG: glycosyltransferase family 2 protein [Rhodospirillaceae bacterium]|nr:glycosyltransferase family 2 protein [Rhodospirillaceae bacterium]
MIKTSIIIPAFNEQATIIEILELVARQRIDGVEFEVIVIDDCSTDRTVALLEERPDLYGKFVKLSINGGKGAAVRAGLGIATGDYVLFQDADLEYDPNDYGKLLEPVLRFNADVVMGSRMVASPITRVSYFWHKVGNRLITLLFNLLNNVTFTDVYSCYLLYRRSLVPVTSLTTDGWEQHAEILTRAISKGKSFYEVPISYYGRTYDEGKKIRAHHVLPVIWTIFAKRLGL